MQNASRLSPFFLLHLLITKRRQPPLPLKHNILVYFFPLILLPFISSFLPLGPMLCQTWYIPIGLILTTLKKNIEN